MNPQDIRDIRGPKTVLEQATWLPWTLVALVVLVALGACLLWRRRGRAVPVRRLSLSEQALENLEKTRPLMLPESAREFGIAASEVIRDYIEKRFGVIATQRTTEEFLQTLLQSSDQALSRHRALLEDFLQRCDFIKFAGASLGGADLESLLQSARGFVLQTGEQPVA